MDSKTTITKPKSMGDVFEKSRKYDVLLKENEVLKKRVVSLESKLMKALNRIKELENNK